MDEATETPQAEISPDPERKPAQAGLSLWVRDFIIIVFVFGLFVTLYRPVRVEGTSMLPVLEDEDRLLINKYAYHIGEIQRGDVVVFLYPKDPTKSYIKRVIALPGDDLRIDHGTVYVNGVAKKEDYVPLKYQDDRSLPELTIPAGQFFMMGDHRSISSDSRDFGPVSRELIYGRAAFVFWPVDQAGMVH